ncbi:MAG: carbohydrate ABC transporter permease, partial [Cyanobacteria bacterium J06627_15]
MTGPGLGRKPWWQTLAIYALMTGIAALMLLPLFWLVSTAFKSPTENIFEFPPRFLPQQP